MSGIIVIFVLRDKKLSSHMDQISEHINISNKKIIPMIQGAKLFLT